MTTDLGVHRRPPLTTDLGRPPCTSLAVEHYNNIHRRLAMDGGAQIELAQANLAVNRVFSTLRDGSGPTPIDGSSPLACASMGLAERSSTGPRQSSGVGSDQHLVPEEVVQGDIERWVDLVDGLALVVRPEVVEDEVALDTGVSHDDDPEDDLDKENFCSVDGMP
ncbi:hypothetical protein HYC85_011354 [Camellia sinensis]|uniref:Uncharacterized protein n=1 Tax=Camellia sinensis TaxID=4442 RepID=A0A7J7HAT1_CAMSI|nr:hypothetical protein HYC85_011354 [Camellia sinensis]